MASLGELSPEIASKVSTDFHVAIGASKSMAGDRWFGLASPGPDRAIREPVLMKTAVPRQTTKECQSYETNEVIVQWDRRVSAASNSRS